MVEDCLPEIWEEFLIILGEEINREGVYCQLYSSRGDDEQGLGIFTDGKGLV